MFSGTSATAFLDKILSHIDLESMFLNHLLCSVKVVDLGLLPKKSKKIVIPDF